MFNWSKKNHVKRVKKEFEKEIENLVGKDEYNNFKKFAFKKSITEVAIAFMLGVAFQKLISSLSDNIVMPVINFLTSTAGEGWKARTFIPVEGLTFEVGLFVGAFVDFLLLAIILYIIYKNLIAPMDDNKIKVIETIDCPNCYEKVFYKAKVCKFCTKDINLTEG